MPEGPEIKLASDAVAKVLVGRTTEKVLFAFDHLRKYERKLTGAQVTSVETRGKAMLTFFDCGLVIYSHNQLYGKWVTCRVEQVPESNRQVRLAIYNDEYMAILYSASDIEVLEPKALHTHTFLSRLGPDLLSEKPSKEFIVERLSHKKFCNKRLAGLLLDQGFVAGLGNYLRAEILFHAKLHPSTKPSECSARALKRLATNILKITERAYKQRGVVTPPTLLKRLKAEGKTHKEQYRFCVYGREGLPCYECGSKIQRENTGGRHIFLCATCQPSPSAIS